MRSVGIKILKNKLSEYVRLAASGETVLVTDRDRVVAELGPPQPRASTQSFDDFVAEGVREGWLTPAKTHWARPIDTPPFYGYALRPGITFTYLGLKVDDRAAVHFGGRPSPNLFVAGEMMAGNVLGQGYTAGVGMSIGTAFGRIAGTQAAAAAGKAHHVHA